MQSVGRDVKDRDDGGDKHHNMVPLVGLRRCKEKSLYGGPAPHDGKRTCGHCKMYAATAETDWVGPEIGQFLPYIQHLVIADALA